MSLSPATKPACVPAPVAVFAFDRPKHLAATLAALARCDGFADHPVTIFCDAAPDEAAEVKVRATQNVAQDWAKKHGAKVVCRPQNLKFGNITTGIDAMCEAHGQVIIIEDDVAVAPDFLRFMQRGLDTYGDDPRIFMVGGYMHPLPEDLPPSFFLPIPIIWGWATWSRAWRHYEYYPKDWPQVLADRERLKRFDFRGKNTSSKMLRDVCEGRFDTWDIGWYFTIFKNDGLCLYPRHSLTWNTGLEGGVHGDKGDVFSAQGTDARDGRGLSDFEAARLAPDFGLPEKVAVDATALDAFLGWVRYRPPFVVRLWRFGRSKFLGLVWFFYKPIKARRMGKA